jgi:hypothetical protein
VDARVDTGRWLEVTGIVSQDRGLVTIAGASVVEATAPEAPAVEEDAEPAAPLESAEVVFTSPYEGEVDVPAASSIRLQFSRGIDPKTIEGQIRVSYVGAGPDAPPVPAFEARYDAGPRAIELKFAQPLDRFRTLRVEVLEGMKAFDGAPVQPFALTYSVGG